MIRKERCFEKKTEMEEVFLFFYCEDGKLKKAETDNGSSLTYCYNQMGQLKKVTDHTGRSVLLQYEEEKLKK